MFRIVAVDCPYCGETFETDLEAEEGETSFTEDCHVCCQPILMRARVGFDGELLGFEAVRENE
jgi:hypothetical protein